MISYPTFDGDQSCAEVGGDWFYLENSGQTAVVNKKLRQICNGCSYLEQCRDWAIKHEKYGFWGGMSQEERQRLRRTNKISLDTPTVGLYVRREEVA